MEHIAKLIAATLNELELGPEEVTEVEIEQGFGFVWSVYVKDVTTYAFFDMAHRNPYEPYTTVQPYTDEELKAYGYETVTG